MYVFCLRTCISHYARGKYLHRHRILWVNSVDLVWNAILASKARDDETDDAVESSKELENSKEVLEIEAKYKESVGT